MKRLSIVLAILLLSSCFAFRPLRYNVVPHKTENAIEIISDPVGARIEINDDYIGDTPLFVEIKAPVNIEGEVNTDLYIRAIPKQAGYTQSKDLKWGRLPKRIFFDMHLHPVGESIKIDIE